MARQMKDSGVEWIGEIPEEWAIARLKTRFFFGKGLPITKENLVPAGVPVVSYGQVHSKSNNGIGLSNELFRFVDESYLATNPQSLVHRGDFIVADTSEDVDGCGNCVYVDSDLVLFAGYHTIILFDKEARDNKYFAYLFQSNEWRNQIRCKVSGVKVFSISRKVLSDAYCTVPPTVEQAAISTYLDLKCSEIDKVVEQTRATIEEYKKLKQAIITEAVTKGVRGPRPMRPSGVEWIGDIPEEWDIRRIKYEVKLRSEKGTYNPKNHKYIGLENIVGFSNALIDTETSYTEAEYQICQTGDVMYSRLRPYLCKSVICPIDGFCTGELMLFSYFTGDKRFLRYWLLSEPVTNVIVQSTYGTKMPRANPVYILNLPMFLPLIIEQQEISAYLDTKCAEIDRIIEKKAQLIEELGSYKKSLIYEYATGKKEVKTNMELKVPYSN